MKYHFLTLTAALLALTACFDGEPQKIAKPIVHPAQTTHPTNVDPASAATDAKVTTGDQQASAAAAAKTGGLNNASQPAAAGVTVAVPAIEAPLLPTRDPATTQDAQAVATDNSGKNVREDGTLPTPLDQGGGKADQTITQGIRQVVNAQDSLSVNARNVKIITQDGVVTLRGPVADARERETVYAIALAQPGAKSVNNLLEPIQK